MIKPVVAEALNAQVNEELYSAYLYAAMAAYFEDKSLKGFSSWMRVQADEELAHARRIIDHLYDRSARVEFKAIAEPKKEWGSPLEAFEDAYKHECHISECINKISTLAAKENDHATHNFLEWFVAEQVEEEANADDMVQQLKLVEGAPGGLFLLDREAAQRAGASVVPGTGGEGE